MKIITMNDFLQNPTGTSSSSFSRRDLIIANLKQRYGEITSKYPIKHTAYNEKGAYYFHLKIPSETYPEKVVYDVVLEFTPIGNMKDESTINSYRMRMFSNSPNFMFTYAYVYNQDKNLIPFLKGKVSKKALTDEPKVKNPQLIYGFEKSVYYALLYIKLSSLNRKNKLDKLPKLNTSRLVSKIISSEKMLEIYNRQKKLEQDKKRVERAKKQKESAEARTTKTLKNSTSSVVKSTKKNERNFQKKSKFKTKKPIKSTITKK